MAEHAANIHCPTNSRIGDATGICELILVRLRLLIARIRQAQINHRQKVLSKRTPLSAVDSRLLSDIGVSQARVLAASLEA